MEVVVAQLGAIIVAGIGAYAVLRSQQDKKEPAPEIARGQVIEPDQYVSRADYDRERDEHSMCHALMREHHLIPPHD